MKYLVLSMDKNFKEQVSEKVRKIPRGKVSTYGLIAEVLGKRRWVRQVGWSLHQNTDPKTPCHRIVDRNGRLAPNFAGPDRQAFSARGGPAFGWDGASKQRRRLASEGVKFRDKMHVDLKSCLWQSEFSISNLKF